MAGATPVDTLLSGRSIGIGIGTASNPAMAGQQGNNIKSGVNALMNTGNSADAIFTRGADAASALQDASFTQAQADKDKSAADNTYLQSAMNAAGFTQQLLQDQGKRNAKLDTVVQTATDEALDANKRLNDPNSSFLDRLGGLFAQSKSEEQLKQLAGVQALENQQVTNTINMATAITAGAKLQAATTTEAQRQATADTAIATAAFAGANNQAKLLSDHVQIQSQVLNQQMNAVQLQDSRMRMSETMRQINEKKMDDASLDQKIQIFNERNGTKYDRTAFKNLPDQAKILIVQTGSGAVPIQKPQDLIATNRAMGISDAVTEKNYPGIMQQASQYQTAEMAVDATNAAQGAKPTAEQRDAQIHQQVSASYKANDDSILTIGTLKPDSSGAYNMDTWGDIPDNVVAAIAPVVMNNADAWKGTGMDAQFQQLAGGLYKADSKQSAKQLTDKLNYVYDALQKNATKTLQQQGIPNDGFGIKVQQYKEGFFGQGGTEEVLLQTPAQLRAYATAVIRENQKNTIRQGQLGGITAPAGKSFISNPLGTPTSSKSYADLIDPKNTQGRNKLDTTK